MTVAAVIFDLDGVLLDSEPVWDEVRRELVIERGGRYPAGSQRRMMGMSTKEWSWYMAHDLGVELPPEEISRTITERLAARYAQHLPLLPGAVDAVERMGQHWPLGLASSSPTQLIETTLGAANLREQFKVLLSSELVARGKPAPDVYLEVSRRLGVEPASCAAIEDSTNGLRSAKAAGMQVVAIPRANFPPERDALAGADLVLFGLKQLSVEAISHLGL
jgi:HAD superfamily hydrolase (TIGR01509 family)